MKIAIHLDVADRPLSLYEEGVIRLYEESAGHWRTVDAFAFALPDGASIPQVRGLAAAMVARLGDCRTLISGGRYGYIYSLLGQEMGLSCWISEGSIAEQLSMVAQKSRELAAAAPACVSSGCASANCGNGRGALSCGTDIVPPPPEDLGGGKLRVDVAAVMRTVPGLNARQILLPIIEGGTFSELEVICGHLPRWFEGKIGELGFSASYETQPGIGVVATLTRPTA